MATYQDQIKTAFDSYTSQGKTPQEIYDAMQKKLNGNTSALSTLNNYYSTVNKPTTSPASVMPAAAPASTTPVAPITAPVTSAPVVANPVTTTTPYSYDTQIKTAFDNYTTQGKTPQQVYEAMQKKLAGNTKATTALNNFYTSYNKQHAPAKQEASTDTTFSNQSGQAIANSGLDTDVKNQMQKHVDTINSQYDDKIKTQQEYAKGVMDSYNANKGEFDAKYQNMRNAVNKMEQELADNYKQLKDAVGTNFTSGMETYARQAAAQQAGISETLSRHGLSGAALSNALSEAAYDPKRLAAIQSLKDKQINDLTNLQQNYNNWANTILTNKASLTGAEKQLADSVLARKDQLDTELNNLKNSNITDVYKPLIDSMGNIATTLAKGEEINAQQNKSLNDYMAATPARKKDMLTYQLKQSGVDIGYVDEAMLNEALKRWSMPDALAYLQSEAKARANAAGKSTTSTGGNNPYSAGKVGWDNVQPTWSEPKTTLNDLVTEIKRRVAKWENIDVIKRNLTANLPDPSILNKINWKSIASTSPTTPSTGTAETSVSSNAGRTNMSNAYVNAAVTNALQHEIWYDASKAIQQLKKIPVSKFIASGSVDKLKKIIVWQLSKWNVSLSKVLEPLAEKIVNNAGWSSFIEVMEQADKQAAQVIADDLLRRAEQSTVISIWDKAATKAIAQKIATGGLSALKTLGPKALTALRFLGGPIPAIVIGAATPEGEAGDVPQFTKRDEYVNNLIRNGVSQEEANKSADKEASYGSFNP